MYYFFFALYIVDGGYTDWTAWHSCSHTCGAGTSIRTRTCSNPLPQHGGHPCQGHSDDSKACNNGPCPGKRKEICLLSYLLQFLLKPQAHSNYKKSTLINIPSGSKIFNISNLTTTKSRLFLFKICKLHKINKVKVTIRHYQVQMTA